jgi:hypothetical protein
VTLGAQSMRVSRPTVFTTFVSSCADRLLHSFRPGIAFQAAAIGAAGEGRTMGDIVATTNVEISDPALQLTPGVGASGRVIGASLLLGMSGIRTRHRSILS